MAQNSTAHFGRDGDVTQEPLTAWAALVGRPAPVLQARSYLRTPVAAVKTSRHARPFTGYEPVLPEPR